MKITYDSEGDVLYIELRHAAACDSVDVEEGVTADLDESGHLVGLEILDASDRLTPEQLSHVSYEELVSEKKAKLSLPAVLKPSPAK
jgi:uncharacterized protein YuzE